MSYSRYLVVLLILLSTLVGKLYALQIPQNLTPSDQKIAAEILGYGSISKTLSNPYPLGGYSGFDFGVSQELILTEDISSLGDEGEKSSELTYTQIYVGKGVYNNLDVYFHFTPFQQSENISNFGAIVKWGFHQLETVPVAFTLHAYSNMSQFYNLVKSQSVGFDIISSVQGKNLSLYFGLGRTNLYADFMGGSEGVTDSQETESVGLIQMHSVIGGAIQFDKLYLALEMSRFKDPSYGAKLGLRY